MNARSHITQRLNNTVHIIQEDDMSRNGLKRETDTDSYQRTHNADLGKMTQGPEQTQRRYINADTDTDQTVTETGYHMLTQISITLIMGLL